MALDTRRCFDERRLYTTNASVRSMESPASSTFLFFFLGNIRTPSSSLHRGLSDPRAFVASRKGRLPRELQHCQVEGWVEGVVDCF
jgi:hypothetical protein